MCEAQFQAEVMDELKTIQMRAGIVSENCLKMMRGMAESPFPTADFASWLQGKAKAVAFLMPTVESLSASNECNFLFNDMMRKGVFK